MKIAIARTGYVGRSNAMLLAQHDQVIAVDIGQNNIEQLNQAISPIANVEIERFLKSKAIDFTATIDMNKAYANADYVIVATPTNYDPKTNFFNTSCVENIIDSIIEINSKAVVEIKSTVSVGFAEQLKKNKDCQDIILSPEFIITPCLDSVAIESL